MGGLRNNDWMRELEQDSQNFVALLSALDSQLGKLEADLKAGRRPDIYARINDLREGVRLVCEVAGVKLHSVS